MPVYKRVGVCRQRHQRVGVGPHEKVNKGGTMLRGRIAIVAVAVVASGVTWVYAQTRSGPTLTTQDYIDIQQLYANYAHALDKGEGARFAATFITEGEFTGGRAAGQASAVRT